MVFSDSCFKLWSYKELNQWNSVFHVAAAGNDESTIDYAVIIDAWEKHASEKLYCLRWL